MMKYIEYAWDCFYNSVNGFGRVQWTMVFFGAVIVGLICLRGFGSRTKY